MSLTAACRLFSRISSRVPLPIHVVHQEGPPRFGKAARVCRLYCRPPVGQTQRLGGSRGLHRAGRPDRRDGRCAPRNDDRRGYHGRAAWRQQNASRLAVQPANRVSPRTSLGSIATRRTTESMTGTSTSHLRRWRARPRAGNRTGQSQSQPLARRNCLRRSARKVRPRTRPRRDAGSTNRPNPH